MNKLENDNNTTHTNSGSNNFKFVNHNSSFLKNSKLREMVREKDFTFNWSDSADEMLTKASKNFLGGALLGIAYLPTFVIPNYWMADVMDEFTWKSWTEDDWTTGPSLFALGFLGGGLLGVFNKGTWHYFQKLINYMITDIK